MSYIRTDGYSLKDPDDDAAFQVMVGDMQRLALAMYKGSPNSAYVMAPWAAAAINGANGYNGIGGLAGGPGASGVDGAGPGGVASGAGGAGSPGGPTGAAVSSVPVDMSDVEITGGTIVGITNLVVGESVAGGGTVTVYCAAGVSVAINASGTVTITYANSNTVTFASADFVGTSKAVKLRELDFCEAGVARKRLVLCSAAY